MSLQILNTIIVYLGVPTIVGALLYIGAQLQTLTELEKSVEKIKHNMKVMLKVLFYNNPNKNMENTAPTLGVYIRDAYLAEHPEITQ